MRTVYYPSVRAKMGDWEYYTSVMRVSDLVKYVKFAGEITPNRELDDILQRALTTRSKQISEYLRNSEQRFFNSLVLATYGGAPKFLPIELQGELLDEGITDKIGILRFDGTETYYALDGQHRLAALKQAVEEDPDRYKTDEVSVVIVSHTSDSEGHKRARRLFTTLNKYVKKTSKTADIVMDEDDGVAIIARRLLRENAFLRKRVKIRNKLGDIVSNEGMGKTDTDYLMAIGTLYKCIAALLPQTILDDFKKIPQQLPDFEQIETGFDVVNQKWEMLIDAIEDWKALQEPSNDLAELRTDNGGFILARPIAITSFMKATGHLLETEITSDKIKAVLDQYSDLNSAPWKDLLWNSSQNKMHSGKEREDIAVEMWRYLFGTGVRDVQQLKRQWSSFVTPDRESALPPNLESTF